MDDSSPGEQDPLLQNYEVDREYCNVDVSTSGRRIGSNAYGWKKVRTSILSTIMIVGGFSQGIIDPCLNDLKIGYNCTYTQISQAIMVKGIGGTFGPIIGAVLVDRFRQNSNLWLGIFALLNAIAHAAIPWARKLSILGLLIGINGFCQSASHLAANTLVLAMWGDQAATPIHLLHMALPLTMTVAPMIAAPFLSSNNASVWAISDTWYPYRVANNGESSNEMLEYDIVDTNSTFTQSMVYVPFSVVGGFAVFQFIAFLTLYFKGYLYEESSQQHGQPTVSFRHLFHCNKTAAFHLCFAISLFFIAVGNKARTNPFTYFLFSFAIGPPLRVSNYVAALLMVSYSGSQALARFIMAFLTKILSIAFLLWVQCILILAVCILLVEMATDGLVHLWVRSALAGLLSGPANPSVISWTNRYVEVKGYMMAFFNIALMFGEFVLTWVTGYLFDHERNYIFYVCVAGSVLVLSLISPLQVAGCLRGDRFALVNPNDDDERGGDQ